MNRYKTSIIAVSIIAMVSFTFFTNQTPEYIPDLDEKIDVNLFQAKMNLMLDIAKSIQNYSYLLLLSSIFLIINFYKINPIFNKFTMFFYLSIIAIIMLSLFTISFVMDFQFLLSVCIKKIYETGQVDTCGALIAWNKMHWSFRKALLLVLIPICLFISVIDQKED